MVLKRALKGFKSLKMALKGLKSFKKTQFKNAELKASSYAGPRQVAPQALATPKASKRQRAKPGTGTSRRGRDEQGPQAKPASQRRGRPDRAAKRPGAAGTEGSERPRAPKPTERANDLV